MSEVSFTIKWSGKEFPLVLDGERTVYDVKMQLLGLTSVEPHSQKILGFKIGSKLAPDEAALKDLNLKPGTKVLMMGTPESGKLVGPPPGVDDVEDDFEVAEQDISVQEDPVNLAKVANRLKTVNVKVMNAPRVGKKLLVLDIDYTLFDHRSTVETAAELMRPHLHEFLTAVYPFYDIIIWSATSMRWIELKMQELGVASNLNYKIVSYVDIESCITVLTEGGVKNCKPLQTIWGRPEFRDFYNPSNTIMFDDISRNFVMNPQNGLKIKAFRQAPLNRLSDTELLRLTEYLLLIKDLPELTQLHHSRWESYVEKHRR